MDKVTQGNAAAAEESASASEELFAQAKELGDMVTVLVSMVKGGEGEAAPAPRAQAHGAVRKGAAAGGYRAVPAHKTQSQPKAGRANGRDWSPRPAPKAERVAVAKAEQIIPLSDDELKDF
jgi:methyl-accepting chemotaxis protein